MSRISCRLTNSSGHPSGPIMHFNEKMRNTVLMRLVRTSFQGRRRYTLGAMLAVVLIAAVFITISRLGGTNRTVPAASTPTPGETGLTKGVARGMLARIGNITPTDLPTTGPASTLHPHPASACSMASFSCAVSFQSMPAPMALASCSLRMPMIAPVTAGSLSTQARASSISCL